MPRITAIIDYEVDYLFVGINPVKESIEGDKYRYFKNNDTFYRLLDEANITSNKVDSTQLKTLNIGITNYYQDHFGDYTNTTPKQNRDAKLRLIMYIKNYKPKKVVFLSKYVAKDFLNRNEVKYGFLGPYRKSKLYCIPFPTMPMKKEEKLKYYENIKN